MQKGNQNKGSYSVQLLTLCTVCNMVLIGALGKIVFDMGPRPEALPLSWGVMSSVVAIVACLFIDSIGALKFRGIFVGAVMLYTCVVMFSDIANVYTLMTPHPPTGYVPPIFTSE